MRIRLSLIALLTLSLHTQAQVVNRTRHHKTPPAATASPAGTTARPTRQLLPVSRVILYSNGVAYIERRGTVTGHAEIDLSFKQSQVDDVLKSMVVLDLGRGRIGTVSYNSSAPPSARMADIPFTIAPRTEGGTMGGLAGVLGQLQGARVIVTTGQRTASGSILTVEDRRSQSDDAKPPVNTHTLVIASDRGELASFDLAGVRSIRLIDERAKRDIGDFASASASARRRDAKTITVTSDGDGARQMLVSYTIAAPIWKTTYRIVLDPAGKPFFQGWAIVDNVGEEDWDNVQLSLISGTPVSFIQPIQKPFYRYRAVVPVSQDLRLTPQIYEPETGEAGGNSGFVTGRVTDPNGAVVPGATVTVINRATGQQYTVTTDGEGNFHTPAVAAGHYAVTISAAGFTQATIEGVIVSPVRAAQVSATLNVGSVSETVTVTAGPADQRAPNTVSNLSLIRQGASSRTDGSETLSQAITGGRSGVEAEAEAGEVGDLFEYRIEHPVTVKRDRSALIPILQTRMEGERVSVYNEAAQKSRPMSGLLLKNTSALTLEEGALTVIDVNAYAGEALMERLKPSEQRLVSFALDLGTLVTVRADEDSAPAFKVRIVNGSLEASCYDLEKKVYTLTNQTDRPRVVYVEHPVRQGWELDEKATRKPEGKSARYYRFRVDLAPRSTVALPVIERQESKESFALSNLSPSNIELFVTRRYIDEPTRVALQHILDLKGRIAALDSRAAGIDKEVGEIGADQKRLRENIEALTKTAEARQLIARYVAKADGQETRIEQLTKEKQAALEERSRLQAQVDSAIRALSLDRSL